MKVLGPLLWILASGCAAVVPEDPARVAAAALEGRFVVPTDAAIAPLLADGLDATDAVRIAVVHNQSLRAAYANLGVARADLVEAGLLHNPVLDAAAGFPLSGGSADLSFGLALDVVDLLYVPLRKRVARAELEEARLGIASAVLDLAWETRRAFFRHQANEELVTMRRRVVEATSASAELARRMRAAGNLNELDRLVETLLEEEARIALRSAEIEARESREELNVLLGLWGPDGEWSLTSSRLPDPPAERPSWEGLERRVVERSLDLEMDELRITATAERLGLDRASALFPEVVVGAEAEREGTWDSGPTLSLPIPLFDRGQARIARAKAELERARALHHATAVRVRSAARSARDRVIGHEERTKRIRDVELPLRDRVVRETALRYHAMQLGPADLLRAKEAQIVAGAAYVESLRDYWFARSDLDLLLAGRVPPGRGGEDAPAMDRPPRFPFSALH